MTKKFSLVDKEKLQQQVNQFKEVYENLDRKHIRDIFDMYIAMNKLDKNKRWHVSYEFEGYTYILTRSPTFPEMNSQMKTNLQQQQQPVRKL